MDARKVIEGLSKALEAAQVLAPIVAPLGGSAVAHAANIAVSAMRVGQTALSLAQQGDKVMRATTADQREIQQLLTDLQAVNDDLARRVAES